MTIATEAMALTNAARTVDAGPQPRETLRGAMLAPDPLYKQVKNEIIRSLAQGEWKPGDMIPSEPKLAARYGVGIATVRAAIGELVAAKVVARKQGKGTFVSLHDERRSIYQFFHVVRNDGAKELPVSDLVSVRKARADDDISDALQLPRRPRSPVVFRLKNILRVSGIPVVVSDIVIPAALFPGLNEKILRRGGETLYAVYQTHFGINIIRTVEQLRAVKADAYAARVLGLPPGDPVLEVCRVAYTFNDVPVEARRSRVETKNFYYLLDQGGAR